MKIKELHKYLTKIQDEFLEEKQNKKILARKLEKERIEKEAEEYYENWQKGRGKLNRNSGEMGEFFDFTYGKHLREMMDIESKFFKMIKK